MAMNISASKADAARFIAPPLPGDSEEIARTFGRVSARLRAMAAVSSEEPFSEITVTQS